MGLLSVYSRGRWTDGSAPAAGSGGGVSVVVGTSPIELTNIEMYRGEEKEFTFTLSPTDPLTGLPLDIRNWLEVWFTAKVAVSDADSDAVFQHRKGSGAGTAGVLRVDPDSLGLNNQFRVYVTPTDTQGLQPMYPYDLSVDCRALISTGRVKEIAFGILPVKPSVTQAVVP